MFESIKAFVDSVWYGDYSLIAWIVTLSPFIIWVALQIPAVVKAVKANKEDK